MSSFPSFRLILIVTYSGKAPGPGPERDAFAAATTRLLQDSAYWRPLNGSADVMVPNFMPVAAMQRTDEWRAQGAFLATHLVRFGFISPRVSKWILYYVLTGDLQPSLATIRQFDSELAETVAPWLSRKPGTPESIYFGTSPDGKHTDIDCLIYSTFSREVNLLSTLCTSPLSSPCCRPTLSS
jgi:hypothetical protein